MPTVGYLLDTKVISETRKNRPDSGVTAFLSAANADALFLSVLTLGELRKGAALKYRTDSVAADKLTTWIDGIETIFADRLLPVDAATARLWGELSSNRPLSIVDTLIAATAISRGLTLVTRNIRDVASTGVPVVDPWQTPLKVRPLGDRSVPAPGEIASALLPLVSIAKSALAGACFALEFDVGIASTCWRP
jgi:predicted nucleic acid-binding protein